MLFLKSFFNLVKQLAKPKVSFLNQQAKNFLVKVFLIHFKYPLFHQFHHFDFKCLIHSFYHPSYL